MEFVNFPRSENHVLGFAFEAAPTPCVVVTSTGTVVVANARARALLGFTPQELGRPLGAFAPDLHAAALQSLLSQAHAEHRSITLPRVEWRGGLDAPRYFDIEATPFYDPAAGCLGASLTFLDTTRREGLQEELERVSDGHDLLRQRFATTGAELQTSREEMKILNVELQTSREEHQTANEELQTSNEELQAANEELQTTNEELNATIEELQVMNREFQLLLNETRGTSPILEALLTCVRQAVIIVDRRLNVLAWNHLAEEMWGLREDEVRGQPLDSLKIGLPVSKLPFAALLNEGAPRQKLTRVALDRRGQVFRCRIDLIPCTNPGGELEGLVLTMEEHEKQYPRVTRPLEATPPKW